MRFGGARLWADAWRERVPDSDPARAPGVAEPLTPLTSAVRHQEFPDGVEPPEKACHQGGPVSASREAVHGAAAPDPCLAGPGRTRAGRA
ncbi:hypothetical protein C6Y14_24945 [Streptomyces dioscori]|uniref:Uncharacterized protein n=1 Tax=Streptomyces dioscori TaxID=2109333 RepID=A0A2P8Q3B6_9ACTN|nr:hypothetical protein C6Y14_24945 [Streptomyces dioscori]